MRDAAFSQLASFVAVAEAGGMTRAARSLGVSASALSQAVRALEERVGVPLLVRTTRRVNLTEAGRALLERVAPALREAGRALDDARSASGVVQGLLRITIGRVAVPFVIEPVLFPLLAAHPKLSLEVSVNDKFVDIVASGFDAGVRLREAIQPDLGVVRLTPPFRLVVAAAPAYLARHGVPKKPRELLRHECVLYRMALTGAPYAWEFERRGREESVAVRGRLICDDTRMMLSAALRGVGLAYLTEFEAQPHVERGELRLVLEDYAPHLPGFFLYFPKGAQRQPKLRAFIDVARRELERTRD